MASNDTYVGSLEVLLKQIAVMSGLVDANLPFVMSIMQMVQDEMRSPDVAMRKAGIAPPQQDPGMDPNMMPMDPGMMEAPVMGMGAPPPSLGPEAMLPNQPDPIALEALLGPEGF